MANEEGSTLLPSAPPPTHDEHRRARRTHVLRVAVGVVSALALIASSVVAVDLLSARQQQQHPQYQTSLSATPPQALEAQFGWSTWCSARATVGCLFSSDKEKCQADVLASCDPDDDEDDDVGGGDGSGSGMGSGSGSHAHAHVATVGSGAGSNHGAVPSVGAPEKAKNKTKKHDKKKNKKKATKPPAHVPLV